MSQKSYDNSPTVYLIPTPIGNMEDITLRAIRILKEVDVIFSEDTRVTGLLLNYLGIKKKLISSHNYNEIKNSTKIIEYLKKGSNVGIVTDRGTPIISDPGYELVKVALENNYNVVGLPGATALIPALITSGLNPSPFLFYGFLNSKESKQKKELINLSKIRATLIFYEAPHRLISTLNNIKEILGNRKISISREISKKFEEIYRGNIENIINEVVDIKGEIVIIVEGCTDLENYDDIPILEHINSFIIEGDSSKEAIKKVAHLRGINKNIVYQEYHKANNIK
jgi:16S rRNA (cytidine1402-2'-O)-methyltransferase